MIGPFALKAEGPAKRLRGLDCRSIALDGSLNAVAIAVSD